jgi:hypothetical protein
LKGIAMKTMTVTINITFDDEPNVPNGSSVNKSAYPPKSGFNFLSSTTKEPWTDFTDKKPMVDRQCSKAKIISFPKCKLLGG